MEFINKIDPILPKAPKGFEYKDGKLVPKLITPKSIANTNVPLKESEIPKQSRIVSTKQESSISPDDLALLTTSASNYVLKQFELLNYTESLNQLLDEGIYKDLDNLNNNCINLLLPELFKISKKELNLGQNSFSKTEYAKGYKYLNRILDIYYTNYAILSPDKRLELLASLLQLIEIFKRSNNGIKFYEPDEEMIQSVSKILVLSTSNERNILYELLDLFEIESNENIYKLLKIATVKNDYNNPVVYKMFLLHSINHGDSEIIEENDNRIYDLMNLLLASVHKLSFNYMEILDKANQIFLPPMLSLRDQIGCEIEFAPLQNPITTPKLKGWEIYQGWDYTNKTMANVEISSSLNNLIQDKSNKKSLLESANFLDNHAAALSSIHFHVPLNGFHNCAMTTNGGKKTNTREFRHFTVPNYSYTVNNKAITKPRLNLAEINAIEYIVSTVYNLSELEVSLNIENSKEELWIRFCSFHLDGFARLAALKLINSTNVIPPFLPKSMNEGTQYFNYFNSNDILRIQVNDEAIFTINSIENLYKESEGSIIISKLFRYILKNWSTDGINLLVQDAHLLTPKTASILEIEIQKMDQEKRLEI